MNRLLLSGIVFVVALACAAPAHAQYRNQGIQGNVGYLGLGTVWDQVLGRAWNINDNLTLGAGHTLALGYNLWFDNTVALGGSTVRVSRLTNEVEPIFSLSISTGLRYMFLEEKFRPFVCGHIQYLQIIGFEDPPIPTNAFLGSAPFWVGARLGGGAEYFFMDEVSLMLELGLAGFFGLNQPPCVTGRDAAGNCSDPEQASQSFVLPASVGRLSVFVYF